MMSSKRTCVLSIPVALVLEACAQVAKPLPACSDNVMTYKYPGEGSIGERYQSGQWWRINTENTPETALTQPEPLGNSVERDASFPIIDCSNAEYICARTYQRVFAVPRGNIEVGATYEIEGAQITIEGCLRSKADKCATALFVSDCRRINSMSDGEVPPGTIVGGNCRNGLWGQQVIFIYDIERGVIAYESADWWKPGADTSEWDLSTLGVSAGLLALIEAKGLLTCRINSVG